MLAPLHVVVTNKLDGTDVFESKVGEHGKVYELGFHDVLRLIRARNGYEQGRLEYKPHE